MTREEAIRRIKAWNLDSDDREVLAVVIPELSESEDERMMREFNDWLCEEIECLTNDLRDEEDRRTLNMLCYVLTKVKDWLEKQKEKKEPEDKGEISDGYHTFNELYYYRMLYNAAFFNLLPKEWVHKSKRHHDGEECFGGGWFIVMANLPTGQVSNHYELKDWDLFQIPEKEIADEWDGHTPQEAAERIHKYLLEKQKEQKPVDLQVKGDGVYKICPRCKERMVRDDSMVYTSMPPQYRYECPKCGESECDTVMYDNPEMEKQKPAEVDESTKRLNDNWMKQHFDDYKERKPAEWSDKEYGRLFDIEHYLDGTLQLSPDRRIACIDFLKSLRPHWKPSEVCYGPKGDPDPAGTSDLEEAAEEYVQGTLCDLDDGPTVGLAKGGFIAGAEWQKKHLTVEDIKTILDISFWNSDPEKILEEYNRLKK